MTYIYVDPRTDTFVPVKPPSNRSISLSVPIRLHFEMTFIIFPISAKRYFFLFPVLAPSISKTNALNFVKAETLSFGKDLRYFFFIFQLREYPCIVTHDILF